MGRQTTAKVNQKNGDLTLQQHDYDSPVLPVAQLEKLHQFKPEAIDCALLLAVTYYMKLNLYDNFLEAFPSLKKLLKGNQFYGFLVK